VLLVEDNPDDVDLTLLAFEEAGVQGRVQVARDGVEALELLLGPGAGPLPVVVLLDLNLPRLHGLVVLERLRAHPRTELLPVVVLTTSTEEQDRLGSYRGRANSYVRKPVRYEDFVEALRQLGLYWLGLNVPPPPGGG
jgi:two-component system response regulator